MTFAEINTAILIESLSEEELRKLVRSSAQRLKLVVESNGLAVAHKLRRGTKVGFGKKDASSFSKQSYKEGKVIKVNKTRAVVAVNGMSWTVPFSMLSIVG